MRTRGTASFLASVRFGRFLMGSLVSPGTASLVQVEVQTASGDVARTTAVWEVVQ